MTIDVHCSIVTATVNRHFMIQLSSTPIVFLISTWCVYLLLTVFYWTYLTDCNNIITRQDPIECSFYVLYVP
jgi:hypothetical protein